MPSSKTNPTDRPWHLLIIQHDGWSQETTHDADLADKRWLYWAQRCDVVNGKVVAVYQFGLGGLLQKSAFARAKQQD